MLNYIDGKLGDIIELLYGKGLPENRRIFGNYPVIGSGGIVGYHNEYLCEGPGIIIGRKGSIGTIQYIKDNYFPIDTVFYVKPKIKTMPVKYIYYLLSQLNLKSLNTDAAVPGLNREVALSQNVKYLEQEIEQQKVTKILSNYDDLIENNNKRIKILEEMAQKIYKEWFVDFKYPGHETVTFKDTELGKIPSDWDIKTLDNFCNIFTGKKNANAAVNKGMYKFFTCAPDPLSIDTYIYDGKAIIIAGNGSYTGRTQFFDGKFDLYQRTYACTLQDSYDEYLIYALFMIMKEKFEKKVMGGMHGAAIPYIVYDDIAKYSFAYNDNIFTNFSMIMKIYIESIFLLKQKNIQLKQTRDLLLPRLLSGEIDVEHMEIN